MEPQPPLPPKCDNFIGNQGSIGGHSEMNRFSVLARASLSKWDKSFNQFKPNQRFPTHEIDAYFSLRPRRVD
jgi:hypothetical protein